MEAIGRVFGPSRPAGQPLVVGSVKTNIGHTEGAAGIAGLIKTVLAIARREIPPSVHFEQPNPNIRWDAIPVTVPTAPMAWPAGRIRRIAGVSAFGYSGTNAHVVIEEAPDVALAAAREARPLEILPLSAKSDPALDELADRYVAFFDADPDVRLDEVAAIAGAGRSHFSHRLAVVAGSAADARATLVAVRAGQRVDGAARSHAGRAAGVVWLFTGQGAQHAGMGRTLYDTEAVFRRAMDRCDGILQSTGVPLLEVIYPRAGARSRIDETAFTQPALFALEYSLAQLWLAWGIRPAAVLGHSVGEYVAACVAGVFSLEDGLRLIAERGRLMQALHVPGAMAAVLGDAATAARAIEPFAGEAAVACVNGPASTVISGSRAAIDRAVASLTASGVACRPLRVSHAFHSPLMDPMLDAFEQAAARVTFSPPVIPVVSNVTGDDSVRIDTPGYWRRHVREAVQFDAGIRHLFARGHRVFLEVGPRPTLSELARSVAPARSDGAERADAPPVFLHSLAGGGDDWRSMLSSLAELYVRGGAVAWADVRSAPLGGVRLPTYPFQRQRCWVDGAAAAGRHDVHPLVQRQTAPAGFAELRFESELGRQHPPALFDAHRVDGRALVPASAFIEMAIAAGAIASSAETIVLRDVDFARAWVLPDEGVETARVALAPSDAQAWTFEISSVAAGADGAPRVHASGRVIAEGRPPVDAPLDVAQVRERLAEELSSDEYYRHFREGGLEYGETFQALTGLWRTGDEALARLRLPRGARRRAAGYHLHPALLDAGFQAAGAVLPRGDEDAPWVPVAVRRVEWRAPLTEGGWCHVLRDPADRGPGRVTVDLTFCLADGEVVAVVEGLTIRQIDRTRWLDAPRATTDSWCYALRWRPRVRANEVAPSRLASPADLARAVSPLLNEYAADERLAAHARMLSALDIDSVDYVRESLSRLGWTPAAGDRFSTAVIARRLGVVERHHRLFARMLAMLAEEGTLRRAGDEWEVAPPPPAGPRRAAPADSGGAEQALLMQCGSKLAGVLRGEEDPLHVLFPGGDTSLAARLYRDSPGPRALNAVAAEALRHAIAAVPPTRGLRVLEIGAGTGGTTAQLLPLFDPDRTEYVFTDVSPMLVGQAERAFPGVPFVRYRALDIERPPDEQDLAPHGFDIVVAANVLHATADLRRTLAHVRRLVAPGGLVVLLEGTAPRRWIDLTFGLTDGWWKFTDLDIRPDHPLVTAARWLELLGDAGFEEPTSLSSDGPFEGQAGTAILVARAPASAAPRPAKRWLILADAGGFGREVARGLAAGGDHAIIAEAASAFERVNDDEFRVDPARRDDVLALASHLGDQPCDVVDLWSLDMPAPADLSARSLAAAVSRACLGAAHWVHAAVRRAPARTSLWLVTEGAQPVRSSDDVTGIAQSPLWGVGRVIAQEHPELACRLVDIDPHARATSGESLVAELLSGGDEPHVGIRAGARHVLRLARDVDPGSAGAPRPAFRDDASYLVTGGFGGLGLRVAEWMVDRGARRLILAGRRPPNDLARAAVRAMQQRGAEIVMAAADIASPEDVERLRALAGPARPLRGVVQAAGVLDDVSLTDLAADRFDRVIAPKIPGTWNLHRALRDAPLDFFVLFSSAASLFGYPGQSSHAAANAFEDAFAHYRTAAGAATLAINWGVWADVGSATAPEVVARLKARGMGVMSPAEAIEALERVFPRTGQVGVFALDWDAYRARMTGAVPPFVSELAGTASADRATPPAARNTALLQALADRSLDEACADLEDYLADRLSAVLGLAHHQRPDADQPLAELGLDSLLAIDLRGRIAAELGVDVPLGQLFGGASIGELARRLQAAIVLDHVTLTASAEAREDTEEIVL
jgi:acyl transferase domain-containing protein